ncbi:hypothetical protein GON09_002569 [Rhodococcus sp. B50]|nr:hypothetical protein [Rhodococcus sp. B50]
MGSSLPLTLSALPLALIDGAVRIRCPGGPVVW